MAAPVLGLVATRAPKPAVIGVLGLVVTGLLLSYPLVAAYLQLIGSAFNYSFFSVGFALIGPGDLLNIAGAGAWIAYRLMSREPMRRPQHLNLMLLYAALILISMMFGPNPSRGVKRTLREFISMAAALGLVDLLSDRRHLKAAVWILLGNSTVHSLLALLVFPVSTRLEGYPDQSNVLGQIVAIGTVVAFSKLSQGRHSRGITALLFAALLLNGLVLVLSISRTAYLAVGLATVWWTFQSRRGPIYLALAVVALLGTLQFFQDNVAFIERRLEMQDHSVTNRASTYRNAFDAVLEFPVLGVGHNQFNFMDDVVDLRAQAGRSAHSAYLDRAAGSGLPAALCFFGFLFLQGWHIRRGMLRARALRDVEAEHLLATLFYLFLYQAAVLTTGSLLPLYTMNIFAVFAMGALLAGSLPGPKEAGTADRPLEQHSG